MTKMNDVTAVASPVPDIVYDRTHDRVISEIRIVCNETGRECTNGEREFEPQPGKTNIGSDKVT